MGRAERLGVALVVLVRVARDLPVRRVQAHAVLHLGNPMSASRSYGKAPRRQTAHGGAPSSSHARVKRNNTDTVFQSSGNRRKTRWQPPQSLRQELLQAKKDIKELKKECAEDFSTLCFRKAQTQKSTAAKDQILWDEIDLSSRTLMLEPLANVSTVRALDDDNITPIDITQGTYNRRIWCDGMFTKINFKNLTVKPVEIWAYICAPKTTGGTGPVEKFIDGINKLPRQNHTNPPAVVYDANTMPRLYYPSDSTDFKEFWRIEKSTKFIVEPGDVVAMAYIGKARSFELKADTFPYQPDLGSCVLMYRVGSPMAEDAAGVYGLGPASIRVETEVTHKFRYNAIGLALEDVAISDSARSTVTTGTRFVNKPEAVQTAV